MKIELVFGEKAFCHLSFSIMLISFGLCLFINKLCSQHDIIKFQKWCHASWNRNWLFVSDNNSHCIKHTAISLEILYQRKWAVNFLYVNILSRCNTMVLKCKDLLWLSWISWIIFLCCCFLPKQFHFTFDQELTASILNLLHAWKKFNFSTFDMML